MGKDNDMSPHSPLLLLLSWLCWGWRGGVEVCWGEKKGTQGEDGGFFVVIDSNAIASLTRLLGLVRVG